MDMPACLRLQTAEWKGPRIEFPTESMVVISLISVDSCELGMKA